MHDYHQTILLYVAFIFSFEDAIVFFFFIFFSSFFETLFFFFFGSQFATLGANVLAFIGLVHKGKDIVFRFIIKYSSLRDFGS
jgi:hypothetical protein